MQQLNVYTNGVPFTEEFKKEASRRLKKEISLLEEAIQNNYIINYNIDKLNNFHKEWKRLSSECNDSVEITSEIRNEFNNLFYKNDENHLCFMMLSVSDVEETGTFNLDDIHKSLKSLLESYKSYPFEVLLESYYSLIYLEMYNIEGVSYGDVFYKSEDYDESFFSRIQMDNILNEDGIIEVSFNDVEVLRESILKNKDNFTLLSDDLTAITFLHDGSDIFIETLDKILNRIKTNNNYYIFFD